VEKQSLQNWINFAQEIGFLKFSVNLDAFFSFIEACNSAKALDKGLEKK